MHVGATPEQVWAVVSDVTRVGEFSPECTGAEWTSTPGGPVPGATFTGSNRHGPVQWRTRCTVVAAEPGVHLSWQVTESAMRWGYRLRAVDGGTELTQYRVQVGRKPLVTRLVTATGALGRAREDLMREGMRRSLAAIARTVERTAQPAPGPSPRPDEQARPD